MEGQFWPKEGKAFVCFVHIKSVWLLFSSKKQAILLAFCHVCMNSSRYLMVSILFWRINMVLLKFPDTPIGWMPQHTPTIEIHVSMTRDNIECSSGDFITLFVFHLWSERLTRITLAGTGKVTSIVGMNGGSDLIRIALHEQKENILCLKDR